MRLLFPVAIAAAVLTLSGCMTAQERREADEAQCRSYGFKRGNDAFAECLQRIDLDRRAQMRVARDYDPFWEPRVVYQPIIVRPPHRHHR